jgi:hypothetical protein
MIGSPRLAATLTPALIATYPAAVQLLGRSGRE